MSLLSLPSTRSIAPPRWLPLVGVFALAILLRHVVIANTDVSWGLTMAEKWLDGARLYVDLIEVNPPFTLFIYAAPAWLGRVCGVPAETMVDVLVFAAVALSLWLCARILRDGRIIGSDAQWPLLAIAAFVLLVLPAQNFGEREHIALIAFLPLLAAAAARAKGAAPAPSMIAAAGVGGGLVAIIKPHFAAAILCTAAAAAFSARSWRPLLAPENWIAAAMLAAYAVFVVNVYPQFITDMLPLLLAVYVPVKAPFLKFIVFFATPIWLSEFALIAWLKGRAALKPPFVLLVAASAGFSFSYYAQQKGWSYHSYPMLALALIALVLAFIDRWHRAPCESAERGKRLAGALAIALIAGTTFCWMNFAVDWSELAGPIQAIKPHPKILALSADLAVGHPITRRVGGTWVSRVSSQWITAGVLLRRLGERLDPATEARLAAAEARDREMLTEDIARNRPDVILVQILKGFDWLAWARSDPALAAQMANYREDRTVGEVIILRRKDGA